jgi:hypothetical protein
MPIRHWSGFSMPDARHCSEQRATIGFDAAAHKPERRFAWIDAYLFRAICPARGVGAALRPISKDYRRRRWRRIDLKRVIAERFGVDFHPRYVGKLLQRLGFSPISARPVIRLRMSGSSRQFARPHRA